MRFVQPFIFCMVAGACLVILGCQHFGSPAFIPDVPRENHTVTISDYVINPPDVLVIDLIRAVPLPPYVIKPQDLLFVHVKGTPAEDPIKGAFRVEPEGVVRFGPAYGSVRVADLTIDEAIRDVEKFLKKSLKEPQVFISLEETRGVQLVRGEHLVRPDGTVNLGVYGRVHVARMTQEKAKEAIEEHLSKYFQKPTVAVDIGGFNSTVYYVIFDGGGSGEQVIRLPYTGHETVLDAIGQVYGLPAIASKSRVWLARPDESRPEDEVYPIDWRGITQKGQSATNYQIFPRDRIYVAAQPLVAVDTYLGRMLAPVERVFGITLLGNSAIRGFRNDLNNGAGQGFPGR